MSTEHVWRGRTLATVGDLTRAVQAIAASGDEAEAREFLEQYREVNEHADENVGYVLGYLGRTEMVAGLRLFGVVHPVLGGPEEAEALTPDEVFQRGVEWAQRAAKEE